MRSLSLLIKPVSGECNMHCSYCFYNDIISKRDVSVFPHMSIKTLETIVRRSFLYADGFVNSIFQGGEPTLIGIDFWKALLELERTYNSKNVPVTNSVQSNGYSLSDDLIGLFAKEHFLLGISLDGIADLHNQFRVNRAGAPTFDRIIDNIRRLEEAGAEFNILCVVNDYVAQRPREVFKSLAPYKYLQFIACLDGLDGNQTSYSLSSRHYLYFLKETFDLYYDACISRRQVSIRSFDNYIRILLGMPPESCAASGQCGQYFLIESNGDVYPCDFYALDSWRIGSILDQPFNRLAKSDLWIRFHEESLPVPAKCTLCKWYPLCRNGCKRERDPETGISRWCSCLSEFFEYSHPRFQALADLIAKHRL